MFDNIGFTSGSLHATEWYWMRLFKRRQSCSLAGFSLLELIVVLVIAGSLMLLVIPFVLKTMRRTTLLNNARLAQVVMSSARLQAVKSSTNIGVFVGTATWAPTGVIVAYVPSGANGTGAYTPGVNYGAATEFKKIGPAILPPELAIFNVTFPSNCVGFNHLGQAISMADGTVLTNCGDTTNGCGAYIEDNPVMGYVKNVLPNIFRIGVDSPTLGVTSLRKNSKTSTTVFLEAPWNWTY